MHKGKNKTTKPFLFSFILYHPDAGLHFSLLPVYPKKKNSIASVTQATSRTRGVIIRPSFAKPR